MRWLYCRTLKMANPSNTLDDDLEQIVRELQDGLFEDELLQALALPDPLLDLSGDNLSTPTIAGAPRHACTHVPGNISQPDNSSLAAIAVNYSTSSEEEEEEQQELVQVQPQQKEKVLCYICWESFVSSWTLQRHWRRGACIKNVLRAVEARFLKGT